MKSNILEALRIIIVMAGCLVSIQAAAKDSVFVGLEDGSVYKCGAKLLPKLEPAATTDTTTTEQCTKLDGFKNAVTAMLFAKGSLYIGTEGGYMWICNPSQAYSCIHLNTFGSEITALAYSGHDKHIYAATGGGTLLKCSPKEKDSCKDVDTFSGSRIQTIYVSGDNMYVGTSSSNGYSVTDINSGYWCRVGLYESCLPFSLKGNGAVMAAKHFGGSVYFANNQISRCPEIPNKSCVSFYTSGSKETVNFKSIVVVRSRLISLSSKGSVVSCPVRHNNSKKCTETYLPIQATNMVYGRLNSDFLYSYRGTDLRLTRLITNNSYDFFKFDSNIYSILYVKGVK